MKLIEKIFENYKLDFFLNLILVCSFLFSHNFLEEDMIIGLCSYFLLIFFFFQFRETVAKFFKKIRNDIKNFYNIQNYILQILFFCMCGFLKEILIMSEE